MVPQGQPQAVRQRLHLAPLRGGVGSGLFDLRLDHRHASRHHAHMARSDYAYSYTVGDGAIEIELPDAVGLESYFYRKFI